MLYKTIVPDAAQLGQNPVQILKISNRGLDKTAAMQKRAAAFTDIIADIQPMQKKAYLHVITTGAYQAFGPQRNGDSFNQDYLTIHPPLAKTASAKTIQLDGGLKKYHDSSYTSGKAKVYQQHQTQQQGAEASGIVKCARYNNNMHRGQLLIEVDADKWAQRLNKRASGQDIYLSIGCSEDHDVCSVCGNIAHTLKQHCDHVNMHKLAVYQDGTRCCMFNDAPSFYDISGVNVPADPIAFVLRKVASGVPAQKAVSAARYMVGTRAPMVMNKAASTLSKLSKMQKALVCKLSDDPIFEDQDQAVEDFIKAVQNYPADQIISSCNRKAILLSPKMLFKIIGKQTDQSDLFNMFADSCPCCGKNLMQDMQKDDLFANQLRDGSFDSIMPVDLNLDRILESFMPHFGVSRPAINGKAIRITIRIGSKPMEEKDQTKLIKAMQSQQRDQSQGSINKIKFVTNDHMNQQDQQSIQKKASLVNDQFRRTYARYVLSFAQRNSQDTCNLALQKIARYK